MPRKKIPLQQRYRVNEVTGCWEWLGCLNRWGYGHVSVRGASGKMTSTPAHRAVYKELRGDIDDRMQLDHICRNRACVNPDHLEPVTRPENCRRGLNAKLTKEQVTEIRDLYSRGKAGQWKLAEMFSVSRRTIHAVVTGRSWVADVDSPKIVRRPQGGKVHDLEKLSEIRRLYAAGVRNCELARMFNLSPASISRFTKEVENVNDNETAAPATPAIERHDNGSQADYVPGHSQSW